MKRIFYLLPIFLLAASPLITTAQLLGGSKTYTRADSLRGMWGPLRSCYDINTYHLDVKIDIDKKFISGSNEFNFTALNDFRTLQFDLFKNMTIEKVLYLGQEIHFHRELDAVYLSFPSEIKKGRKASFTVFYSGSPSVARRPPWDGGFIFSKDRSGNPWVSVACQGFGASSWWPTKDHQSDEVDSMTVSISIPNGLDEVSNGRLISKKQLDNNYTQYNWRINNPINNYSVSFYIGKYAHWTDTYQGENGPLTLDFWALREDSTEARPHWDADVKPMLKSFESWFGPYPFYTDGYKLVQAPHLGMEHQSAVAYGNKFKKGYLGSDLSGSGWGMKFDFITVHESGHEWFGNNITSKDIADMWIHEGFTCYSEALFTESLYGKDAASAYVQGIRMNISNDIPIIGPYNVNKEGSGDMYYKGANLIHMIRQLMGNDDQFRAILRGLNQEFYHQTVTTQQIESYIAKKSGLKLDKVFDQYLRDVRIPVLEYKIKDGKLTYRWKNVIAGFDMPLLVTLKDNKTFSRIHPETTWKTTALAAAIDSKSFMINPNFYIKTQVQQ